MSWVHYVIQGANKNHSFNWNKLGRKQSSSEKKQRELLLYVYLRAFQQLLQWGKCYYRKIPCFLNHCLSCRHLKQVILEVFFRFFPVRSQKQLNTLMFFSKRKKNVSYITLNSLSGLGHFTRDLSFLPAGKGGRGWGGARWTLPSRFTAQPGRLQPLCICSCSYFSKKELYWGNIFFYNLLLCAKEGDFLPFVDAWVKRHSNALHGLKI